MWDTFILKCISCSNIVILYWLHRNQLKWSGECNIYSAVSKPDEVTSFRISSTENSPNLLSLFLPLPEISAVCPSAQRHSSMLIPFIYHEGDIHRFCSTSWLYFAASSYGTRSVQWFVVVFFIKSSCKNDDKETLLGHCYSGKKGTLEILWKTATNTWEWKFGKDWKG